jgi:hypothetical protein
MLTAEEEVERRRSEMRVGRDAERLDRMASLTRLIELTAVPIFVT